jgi:hypothetical protein
MTGSTSGNPTLNGRPHDEAALIVDRLTAESGHRLPRRVVAELVAQCQADLQPITDAALPEMLERLARHRLAYYLRDASAWQN